VSSGCTGLDQWACNLFKVGPDYFRPAAPVADQWIDSEDPGVTIGEADYSHWWVGFNDPILDQLVHAAVQQNLPLQEAGMRILQARAQAAIARGNLWAQAQQAIGGFSHTQSSGNTGDAVPPGGGAVGGDTASVWNVGFNASWELDFWGRFRRNIQAADAQWDASIEDYDDMLVILQADVAQMYIQMRVYQERLALAKANLQLQEATLKEIDQRLQAGDVSELDVATAQENLAFTRSEIPDLQRVVRQTQNALCVLLGEPPHSLSEQMGDGSIPEFAGDVAIGIPADLLRRRPDVRRAERLAAAQSARIGIAEADFYPRIALTGSIGMESSQLNNLFSDGSFAGAINPGFTWNILNYGRIRNNVRGQEARFYELVIEYQNRVLVANREAEDAIASYLHAQERAQHLGDAVAAAKRYRELVKVQYTDGEATALQLVDSERTLRSRQDQWATSRGEVAVGLVALYRALGGGWEMRYYHGEGEMILPVEMLDAPELPVPVVDREEVTSYVVLEDAPEPPPSLFGKIPDSADPEGDQRHRRAGGSPRPAE